MKQLSKLNLILTFAIMTFNNAYAINYEVIGPCSEIPLQSGNFNVNDFKDSVGKTSVSIFLEKNIPYIGNESGFNSINNTAIGVDSIEVVSPTKLRAYGWCFSVNQISPDVMADNYFFSNNNDKLIWYYAYSTHDSGNWVDYCVPSYQIKATQFCKK